MNKQATVQTIKRAAFDLGSGLFKMVVAELNIETMQIHQVLIEKMMSVQLGDDFKKHGTISQEGEEKAIQVLTDLVSLAKQVAGDTIVMKGIATAIFRKSGKRGAEVLSCLNQIVGNLSFIKEISAEVEGQIGLRTARIVAKEKNPSLPDPLIAWDSGNASFQISYEINNEIEVLAGNIGGSDVKALYVNEIVGLKQYDVHTMNYQTISYEKLKLLLNLIEEHLPSSTPKLNQLLAQENRVVATIGDPASIFSLMQTVLGENCYSKDEVKQFLFSLVNRSSITDLESIYPTNIAYMIPMTSFLYIVMDKYQIESIENYVTAGSTRGLLITPQLWEES